MQMRTITVKRAITFECSLIVQENARISQARTNVLVIQDTVESIVRLTLMTVNLHHAYTVGKILLSFFSKTMANLKGIVKGAVKN